jgi:hypothetical protein
MAIEEDEFSDVLDMLLEEYDKANLRRWELKISIIDEALELVESMNSREVADPEYSYGGDR